MDSPFLPLPLSSSPSSLKDHFEICRYMGKQLVQNYVQHEFYLLQQLFFQVIFSFFLELYFWAPSVNWYVNRKEFLVKKRYKYIIIVHLGLESEKNPICYQLSPWSICYKIFPGEFCQEKKLLFLLFAHDNLRSVPVWNINYMFILVMTCILSFSSVLILHEITIPRQLCYHWRTEHKPYPRLCTMKIFRMRHRETE